MIKARQVQWFVFETFKDFSPNFHQLEIICKWIKMFKNHLISIKYNSKYTGIKLKQTETVNYFFLKTQRDYFFN